MTIRLTSMRIIKLQRKLGIYLLFFLITTTTVGATEYIQEPFPSDQTGVSIHGEEVVKLEATEISYWQFLLWLATVQVLTSVDLLFPARLILAITGYRIVDPSNILDNPSRSKVYAYIKTRPGAYISEIVEQIGLDRGTVKYHVKTLKAKKKIEAYKDGGKIGISKIFLLIVRKKEKLFLLFKT